MVDLEESAGHAAPPQGGFEGKDEAAPRHWCLPLMARDAQNAAHFAI